MVAGKTVTAGFVVPEDVFSLFEPVFHFSPAIENQGHIPGCKYEVGDDEPYPGEKLSHVPGFAKHHPARPVLALRLVKPGRNDCPDRLVSRLLPGNQQVV